MNTIFYRLAMLVKILQKQKVSEKFHDQEKNFISKRVQEELDQVSNNHLSEEEVELPSVLQVQKTIPRL